MSKINSLSRELQGMKGKTLGQKLGFIWDYYKWHIMITLFVVISVIATAISLSNEKEIVLSGYLLDSYYTTDHDEPFFDFAKFADLDMETQEPYFIPNLSLNGTQQETAQQLFSTMAAGQTDFVVASPSTFLRLAYDSFKYFSDLRKVLTPQQLEQLSDRLFYVDASLLDQLESQQGTVILPDHDKPETMKDPVPIGINIRGGRGVDPLYLGDEPVFIAIADNAPNLEMTKSFIDYIFSEAE